MVELIVKGGIFMYPIIFCSVIALAVFLERLWILRRKQTIPAEFVSRVEDLLGERMTITQWLGAVLVVGGVLLLTWRQGPKKSVTPEHSDPV